MVLQKKYYHNMSKLGGKDHEKLNATLNFRSFFLSSCIALIPSTKSTNHCKFEQQMKKLKATASAKMLVFPVTQCIIIIQILRQQNHGKHSLPFSNELRTLAQGKARTEAKIKLDSITPLIHGSHYFILLCPYSYLV